MAANPIDDSRETPPATRAVTAPATSQPEDRFDAFICYRRKDSTNLASWLRTRLAHYRPPGALLGRLSPEKRALFERRRHFFLDTAYKVASEDFWVNNIEPALAASRFLIVIASAGAFEPLPEGGENWVEREIRTFLRLHGDPSRIILVLPPAGDFRRLPAGLAEVSERWDWVDLRAFRRLPWRWIGLRRLHALQTEFLKIVARLFDVPRSLIPDLTQEEARRRSRVWTWAVLGIGLTVLAVAAVPTTVAIQRNRLSQITQSRLLANTAHRLSDASDHSTAAAVALEAMQRPSAWLPDSSVPEAEDALFRSLTELRERAVLRGHGGTIFDARFTRDGRRLVSIANDKTIRVWDAETGAAIRKIEVEADVLALSQGTSPEGHVTVVLGTGTVLDVDLDRGGVARVFTLAAGRWERALLADEGDGLLLVADQARAGKTASRVAIARPRANRVILDRTFDTTVTQLALSANGTLAGIGLDNGQVLLVDLHKGGAARVLAWGEQNVIGLQFASDGRFLMAATGKAIRVWDLTFSSPPISMASDRATIFTAAISADGGTVATGHWDNCIVMWNVRRRAVRSLLNTPCRRETDYPLRVTWLAFLEGRGELVSASDDRKAIVWDTAKGSPKLAFVGHGDRLTRVVVSTDARRFATISSAVLTNQHDMHVWTRDPALAPVTLDHGGKVSVDLLVLSPDERRIATATSDGGIRLWDADTGQEIASLKTAAAPSALIFSPDSRHILVGGAGRVLVWDPNHHGTPIDRTDVTSSLMPWSSSVSPPGLIAFGTQDRSMHLLDIAAGSTTRSFARVAASPITLAAISPDGRRIAYGTGERSITIWEVEGAKPIQRLTLPAAEARDVRWSPDAGTLLVLTLDHTLHIWRVGEEKPRLVHRHADQVEQLLLDGTGQYALTRTENEAFTFDLASTRLLAKLSDASADSQVAHTATLHDAQFSPDGRHVVTASYDRTAKVWRTTSGAHVMTLTGYGDFVHSAQFTPNGARIVTTAVINENSIDTDQMVGVSEAKVIVWDVATGKMVAQITADNQSVPAAVITRDGRRLLTSSWKSEDVTRNYVWPLFRDPAEITGFACSKLPRQLTADQRLVLVPSDRRGNGSACSTTNARR